MNKVSRGAAILLAILWVSISQGAGAPEIWRELEPGPYDVGFRTLESYDHSRTLVPKYDYMGEPNDGIRARPIIACLWYPASTPDDALQMSYGEYAFPYPEDDRFFAVLSRLQDREVNTIFGITRDQAAVLQMMSTPMYAVRDAEPLTDTFPLVVYHQSLGGAACENALLCEYLASHGFLVMTTPALGLNSLTPTTQMADLENLIRDKEYALGMLDEAGLFSFDQLYLLGNALGGLAALDMQMRNADVEGVIALGDMICDSAQVEYCRRSPSFNPDRMDVPLLLLTDSTVTTTSESVFETFHYSPHTWMRGMWNIEPDLLHYPMFTSVSSEMEAMMPPLRGAYHRTAGVILAYLEGLASGQPETANSIRDKIGSSVTMAQYPAEQLPPTAEQFARLIQGEYLDTAVALFHYFHETEPERVLFAEALVNAFGYRALQAGDSERAIKLFLMNTVAYPNSCNSWDSLSDGYLAAGDNENAVTAMKRALATIEIDTTNPEALKEQIRTKCEQTIAELGG